MSDAPTPAAAPATAVPEDPEKIALRKAKKAEKEAAKAEKAAKLAAKLEKEKAAKEKKDASGQATSSSSAEATSSVRITLGASKARVTAQLLHELLLRTI